MAELVHIKPTRDRAALPAPPKAFTVEASRLWRAVTEEWELDPAALVLLDAACRSLMRARQAQALLAKEGLVLRDRHGQARPHPAAAVERDAHGMMLRFLKGLGLDLEPLHVQLGRPGGTRPGCVFRPS
jgi:P27 family predicted phage terminase small subunit